jgi:hypothetical protein
LKLGASSVHSSNYDMSIVNTSPNLQKKQRY